MSRQFRLAPFAVVAAIAIAGCGSSGTASHATAAKTLVAQADPICKQVATQREAANSQLHGVSTSTLNALARIAPKVAATEHKAVVRLRALTAPASVAHDWNQMLTGIAQLANDTTQIGNEARAKNLKQIEALTSSGRKLRGELTAIAERDGFSYCGRTS